MKQPRSTPGSSANAKTTASLRPQYHFVGSGIASLSGAVQLIRAANVDGKDIVIYDVRQMPGGCLDAEGNPEEGYVCRGTRGFDLKAFVCLQDVFSEIPNPYNKEETLNDMILRFCEDFTINSRTRLMRDGSPLDASAYGLALRDQPRLLRLLATPDAQCSNQSISDFFRPEFFESNFWAMFRTLFAFGDWHSAAEMRRYMITFMQNVPDLHTMSSIRACPLNNYDNVVVPFVEYLQERGVRFELGVEVLDVDFAASAETTAQALTCKRVDSGETFGVPIRSNDRLFVTVGSIAEPFDAPAWTLWTNMARGRPHLGNPHRFTSQEDKSQMVTVTLTCADTELWDLLEERFGETPDINRLTTFLDSPWSTSLVVPKQPWFRDQPEDVKVLWSHSIWPKGRGKYVHKTQSEVSAEEFKTELLRLLGFNESEVAHHTKKIIARKCVLPAGHAQFLCRKPGDRPQVVPEGSTNMALLGQYVELPSPYTTYTMEYSVRGALMAVNALAGIRKELPEAYNALFHGRDVVRGARALLS